MKDYRLLRAMRPQESVIVVEGMTRLRKETADPVLHGWEDLKIAERA